MSKTIFGDAGCFYIPDAGLRVPLYDWDRYKGNGRRAQTLVDAEDSAVYMRRYLNGHCDYIGDHAGQGFDRIRACRLDTAAYIVTPNSTQLYYCVAQMQGQNLLPNFKAVSGQKLTGIQWADLCACCCNYNNTGVYMILFRKGLKLPYNLFPDIR